MAQLSPWGFVWFLIPVQMAFREILQAAESLLEGSCPIGIQPEKIHHQGTMTGELDRWHRQPGHDAKLLIELTAAAGIDGKMA